MRNCKNTREVDPINKLCPPCNTWFKEKNKRLSSLERQQNAREDLQNQNRNLNSPGNSSPMNMTGASAPPPPPPASSHPPLNVTPPFHPSTASLVPPARPPTPPPIDITSIQDTYNQLKNSATESPATLDMFALMLNIHSKMSDTEAVRCELKKATTRLDALEAKVGDDKEVAERLGLAIRFLPLPPSGYTDLDIAKQILAEIRAPGVNVDRDVVKAVRKIPSKASTSYQPILGTVLVEMKNEESRAGIMKNKHTLQYHPDNTIRSVVIKNMKSREQMLIENIGNNILKRIPGCENAVLGGNGQIRESFGQPRHLSRESQPPQFRHQNPPPYFRSQVQPPRSGPQSNPVSTGFRPYNLTAQPPNHTARPQYPLQNTVNQGFRDLRQQDPLPQNYSLPPQTYAYTPARMQTPPVQSSSVTVPYSYVAAQPPPAPQPQVRPPAPFQDLLNSLDSLYEQQSGPASSAGPDLHLMQPADPHHGQADQVHLQQGHAGQNHHQVGDLSDSD